MNQHCKHIVLAANDGHIVLKLCGVYLHTSARKHFYDVVFESIEIHLNIRWHRIVCASLTPIICKIANSDGGHHTIRIEHWLLSANVVSVVPTLHFAKIHIIFLAKCFYLVFGETKITRHLTGNHHRIFDKIVQRRFRFILFDWQDSRHIHTGKYVGGIDGLEHSPEPSNVPIHNVAARLKFTANGIPLVNYQHKLVVRGIVYTYKAIH